MAAVPWNFGSQTTAAVFTNEFIHQDRRYKPCQAPCVCVCVIHSSAVVDVCMLDVCVFVRYSLPDAEKGQQTNTKPTESGHHRARREALGRTVFKGQKGRGASVRVCRGQLSFHGDLDRGDFTLPRISSFLLPLIILSY